MADVTPRFPNPGRPRPTLGKDPFGAQNLQHESEAHNIGTWIDRTMEVHSLNLWRGATKVHAASTLFLCQPDDQMARNVDMSWYLSSKLS